MQLPKRFVRFMLIIIGTNFLYGRNIDSLKLEIDKTENTQKKLELIITLLGVQSIDGGISLEEKKEYKKNALEIVSDDKDSINVFDIEFGFIETLLYHYKFDTAKKTIKLLKRIADEEQNDTLRLKAYYAEGYYYLVKTNFEQAIKSFELIHKNEHFNSVNKILKIKTLGNLEFCYDQLGNSSESFKYKLLTLNLSLIYEQHLYSSIVYEGLGSAALNQNNYTNALSYFNKVIKFRSQNNLPPSPYVYFYIGRIKYNQKNYKDALLNFRKSLEHLKPEEDLLTHYIVITFLAKTNIQLKNYDKATYFLNELSTDPSVPFNIKVSTKIDSCHISYLENNTKIPKQYFKNLLTSIKQQQNVTNHPYFKTSTLYLNIGYYYRLTAEYKHAIYFLNKAYTIEKEEPFPGSLLLDILSTITETYKKIGDYKNAYAYSQEFVRLSNKLKKESDENYVQMQQLIEKYVNDKQKADKVLMEQEKELLKKNNHINRIYFLSIIIVIILIGLFLYSRLKQKVAQKEMIHQLNLNRTIAVIEGDEEQKKQMSYYIQEKLSQDLISAKYALNDLENNNETSNVNRVNEKIDNSLNKLKEISYNLAPPTLEFMNINDVLDAYCEEVSNTHSVSIRFEHVGNDITIEKKKQLAIYRIVQELVNNIVEHANSKTAVVQLINTNNQVIVNVEDTGKGSNEWKEGFGWKKIKYRMSLLNATHQIQSNENGTYIQIKMAV